MKKVAVIIPLKNKEHYTHIELFKGIYDHKNFFIKSTNDNFNWGLQCNMGFLNYESGDYEFFIFIQNDAKYDKTGIEAFLKDNKSGAINIPTFGSSSFYGGGIYIVRPRVFRNANGFPCINDFEYQCIEFNRRLELTQNKLVVPESIKITPFNADNKFSGVFDDTRSQKIKPYLWGLYYFQDITSEGTYNSMNINVPELIRISEQDTYFNRKIVGIELDVVNAEDYFLNYINKFEMIDKFSIKNTDFNYLETLNILTLGIYALRNQGIIDISKNTHKKEIKEMIETFFEFKINGDKNFEYIKYF